MPEFEESGYQGTWLPGRRLDGGHGLVVVAKRRFMVDLADATCRDAGETPPIALAPEYRSPDDPARSSVVLPAETALEKPRVDVLVRGTAFAPGGDPVPEFEVGLRIAGVLERRLRILGPRTARFVPPKKWLKDKELDKGQVQTFPPPEFSPPGPLSELPLVYEYAYGGEALLVQDDRTKALAEAARAAEEEKEARKKRKKEIEEELKKEEEAKKAPAEAPGKAAATEKAREAFGDGAGGAEGTRTFDAAALEDTGSSREEMKVASAFRLGRDLPDRPEAADPVAGLAGGEDSPEVGGPGAGVFTEGTAALDPAALGVIVDRDDLHEDLRRHDAERRAKVRDDEGTLIVRTDGMEDVAVAAGGWEDEAGRRPGEAKPKAAPEESPHPKMPYPANPAGRGFCVSPLPDAVDGLRLPQIEDPAAPLRPEELVRDLAALDLRSLPPAAGFGAYPSGWFPRAGHAGVMPWDLGAAEAAKEKAAADLDPDDPDDRPAIEAIRGLEIPVMSPRFFQEANPALQIERLRGDEEVLLENLTPSGRLYFRLPGTHPRATFDLGKGARPVPMRLDSLVVDVEDPDRPFVELVWRGWHPLRDFSELEEATRLVPHLVEIGEDAWLEAMHAEEAGRKGEEGTKVVSAMDDEAREADTLVGIEAEARYRKEISSRPPSEAIGPPKDEGGTVVLDTSREHRLADDRWAEEAAGEKAALSEEAREKAALAEALREKELRKKAREIADREAGIEKEET